LRNGAARRGRSPEGVDGGDAQTESRAEEGLRWRKTGEVDAWAMGSMCSAQAWTCEANDMRGKKKVGQRPLAPFKGSGGEGRKVWRRVEAERERKRKRVGPWARRGPARWRGVGVAAARPRHARATHCRAIMEGGGVGAMRTTWLTGGPGHDGGAVS
jgi:hypothetical protein